MKKFRIKWVLILTYVLFSIIYTTVQLIHMLINLI